MRTVHFHQANGTFGALGFLLFSVPFKKEIYKMLITAVQPISLQWDYLVQAISDKFSKLTKITFKFKLKHNTNTTLKIMLH